MQKQQQPNTFRQNLPKQTKTRATITQVSNGWIETFHLNFQHIPHNYSTGENMYKTDLRISQLRCQPNLKKPALYLKLSTNNWKLSKMFLSLPVVTGTKCFLVQYSSAIVWMGTDVNTVYVCQRWSGLKCMKDVPADSRAKTPHTGLLHLSSNQCHNWLRHTPVGTQMAASFNRPFKLYQAFFSTHCLCHHI